MDDFDTSADLDGAAEQIQAVIDDHHSYLAWLGTTVDSVGQGAITLSIPFDEKLTNPDSTTVHGGVASTLVDTAGGLALRTELDDPIAGGVATVSLTVNYLRPATDDLTASADVIRAGKTIGVSEVDVECDGRLVATGQASYRLFRVD